MNKTIVKMLVASALLCLAGCSPENNTLTESAQLKQLIYGMSSEIVKVNPVLDESQEIDALLFRGLTKPNAENQVVPDLAENWEISDDQLTYTFMLRQDALWEDGEPVTAKDVKFTFDQIRNPQTNTPIAGEFNEIKSVEAIGDIIVLVGVSILVG